MQWDVSYNELEDEIMKLSRLVVTAGLILAVSTAALGTITPNVGPVVFKTNDVSSGTLYPTGAAPILGPGAMLGEDGWGLLQVMQINAGSVIGFNDIASTGQTSWNNPIGPPYQPGDRQLFGVYWNIQDLPGGVSPGPIQTTESAGLYFAIWEQDAGVAGVMGAAGTAGRGLPWTYTGIGGAGNPVLWLTGQSTAMGLLGTLAATEYYAVTDTTVSGTGFAETYLEVADLTSWVDPNGTTQAGPGKGVLNDLLDSDFYVGTAGQRADLYLKMTTSFPGSVDWTLTSDDDVAGIAVPEPITVLAVFLGVSGLGGYVRRRTRV